MGKPFSSQFIFFSLTLGFRRLFTTLFRVAKRLFDSPADCLPYFLASALFGRAAVDSACWAQYFSTSPASSLHAKRVSSSVTHNNCTLQLTKAVFIPIQAMQTRKNERRNKPNTVLFSHQVQQPFNIPRITLWVSVLQMEKRTVFAMPLF
jgi:hypothetical protein